MSSVRRLSAHFLRVMLFVSLTIVVVAVVLVGGYVFNKWLVASRCSVVSIQSLQNGQTPSPEEVVTRVKQLLVVPDGEEPAITQLSDVEQLKITNQRVYQDAEDGDQLLLFSDRAIIYSPKKNKIVNMVALTIASPAASTP